MDYIQLSTDIINQKWHTLEDMKNLSKYKYYLAIEYKETNTRGSAREWSYNWFRSSANRAYIDEWMAITKAGWLAKDDAEQEYWDYGEIKSEAQGIMAMIKAIEWFIIVLQIEHKSLNDT